MVIIEKPKEVVPKATDRRKRNELVKDEIKKLYKVKIVKMHTVSMLKIGMIGFLAQMIDGALGMGYGVTSSVLLISFGFPPIIVSASVHTSELFVSLISGVAHFKFGNINKNLLWPLISFGIIGGILGAYGLIKLPSYPTKLTVGLILLSMGSLILYRFLVKYDKINSPVTAFPVSRLRALGFFAAFIDAMGGGGWGPICTPSLIVAGAEPNKAIGSVNLAEFFITLAVSITFFLLIGFESFRLDLVLALLIGGIIAAPFAAFICKQLPKRPLGVIVGITVIVLSLHMLLKR